MHMISSIITRETKKEDWSKQRDCIRARILETFGTSPVALSPTKNTYEILERYTAQGMDCMKIRYHVFDDEWSCGLLFLPPDLC